jgi:hypothetical protein
LSLFKSFAFNDSGSRLELRAESFNAWNHTQFSQVSNSASFDQNPQSPTFGKITNNFGAVTSAFDPRVFQFGAKLYF